MATINRRNVQNTLGNVQQQAQRAGFSMDQIQGMGQDQRNALADKLEQQQGGSQGGGNKLGQLSNMFLSMGGVQGAKPPQQGGGLDEFILKEQIKQRIKRQGVPAQIPEGFEITEFRSDGTPVIKKIKEEKTPSFSQRRTARKDIGEVIEEGERIPVKKNIFGKGGKETALQAIGNLLTPQITTNEFLAPEDAERALDAAKQLGKTPEELGLNIPTFNSLEEADAAGIPAGAAFIIDGEIKFFND